MQAKSRTRVVARWGLVVAAMFATLVAGPALHGKEQPKGPPKVSYDGLELVPGTQVEAVWVSPDADFSVYERILILDAHVAFRKNWASDQRRTSLRGVSNRDIERMKRDTAELFREVFVKELGGSRGYPIVDSPDTDVLLLRPAIVDLDVTAPDLDGAGQSYNFAASAGAATLYLELFDSVSGDILARVIDRKVARDRGGFMRWTDRVSNRLAAEKVLGEWAALLRRGLDEIHGR